MSDRQPARWWNTVVLAAAVSLIATFWFPPYGVVLFMVTTVMAVRRFREMPVTATVVVAATVLTAMATPASFPSAHPAGPRPGHVAPPSPSPSPSR